MPSPPAANASFDRILVIATRQIGDVLLTTPLIRAARRRWPNAVIDVLAFRGTLGTLEGNPDLNAIIEVLPGSGWRTSIPLMRRLWRRYDLALITDGGDRAHLYGLMAARLRSGLVPGQGTVSWWKRLSVRHAVTQSADQHVVVEKQALLAPWLAASAADPVVAPRATALPADVVAVLHPAYAVLHVPSMWRYKQWPLRHYRELTAALLADGCQVVLTGGPGEGDRARTAEIAGLAAAPAVLDLAGRLEFGQLATLLRGCSVYIGPDTSITHLAAACGASVVALFGPTPPLRWGPLSEPDAPAPATSDVPEAAGYRQRAARQQVGRVILMQGPNDCVPCGKAGCDDQNDSRSECLERLDPQRVIAEARRVLSARSPEAVAGARSLT